MSQTSKLPRPTGLPIRLSQPMTPPAAVITTAPPFASRRGALSRPAKATLRLSAMVRDVKSVHDLADLAVDTTCVRKSVSYNCVKAAMNETKRKLEPLDCTLENIGATKPKQQVTQIMPADSSNVCSKPVPAVVMADCEKVLQTLHAKVARNSSEFDDSVASFLSEQTDLLDVRLDISVASVASEVADRTPSVEDLPMECEAITPGAVISAMSLDTGYQGDGELSRPESRNAESEVPVLKVHDDMKTMTDSDFFTESDADGHDESGLSKRDRKAQVIDGTLYGGPTERSLTEDMESSGIYSDLERKQEPPAYHDLISQQIRTIQSIVISHRESNAAEPAMVKSSSGDSSSTIQETPTVKVSPAGSVKKETVRKIKMPNRNVESKVKTLMINETSNKTDAKPRAVKRGKWDAVMDKIAAGREKQPSAARFRDVKSKVFQISQTTRGSTTQPLDGGKMRSRRSTRVRSSESSLVSPKSKQSRTSANSSQHSSISDLSVSSSHPSTAARVAKKREGPCAPAARDHVPAPSVRNSARTRDTNGGVSKGQVTSNNGTMKGPVGRRPNTPRSNPPLKDINQNGVVTKSTSTNSISSTTPIINNNTINFKAKVANRLGKSASLARPGAPRVQKDSTPVLRRHLAESHKAVEALAALLNYCAHDLDAFKTPSLKKDLETAQCRMHTTEADLRDSRTACHNLEMQLEELKETLAQQQASESDVRCELENEHKRAVIVLEELEVARANCQRLEGEVEIARDTVEQLRTDETEYKAQLRALSDLSSQFDKVLSLKREADECLKESRNQNGTLLETLQDKDAEIKMLSTDNGKLREKVNRLASENNQLHSLRSEVERLRAGQPKESDGPETESIVKERLCVNQRLSVSELERGGSPGEKSEHTLLSEVESLRQVLALKTEEVSELRRLELHLRVEADRVPKLLSQVTTLEAKVEDLQSQLSSQLDVVRNLNKAKETLQEELKTEVAQKTRLSHKNEELQYKLRVNSEAMWQLVNRTMGEERPVECSSIGSSPRRFEDARPQMMGVVQKSDSVSYMLDMGEDTAEVVSNIVRRAESVRTQSLPKKKRARTLDSADTTEYYSCADSPSDSPSVTPRRPGRSRACVRLLHSDFANDSIELPREADCEVIEISGSFDRAEPDMSCSTSSNSSSNFDIESEVYPDSPVLLRFPLDAVLPEKRLDPEGEDTMNETIEADDGDQQEPFRTPLGAAGEAMVSSDEEELK